MAGVRVAAIHGNKSQGQRERALDAFRSAHVRALVATDIAARGIDIEDVSHVVNYELPDVPESYVHRIGRTARAGAAGEAISLCDASERDQLREIERVTRQRIPAEDRRNDAGLQADAAAGRPHRGGHPRREMQRNGSREHRAPSSGSHRGGRHGDHERSKHATHAAKPRPHNDAPTSNSGSDMAGIRFMATPTHRGGAGESRGEYRHHNPRRNRKPERSQSARSGR
jgi:ATP-dependent RNA helicase RhlE